MDIGHVIIFGLDSDRERTICLLSKLSDRGFGIEVVKSSDTHDALAARDIRHIQTNSVDAVDLFSNLRAWCNRNDRHCAVLIFPFSITLTERNHQFMCHAK